MRFSTLELQQLAGIAAGGVVVAVLIVLLVRWLKKMDAIWPDAAKALGLLFREDDQGNPWVTNVLTRSSIVEGVLDGVPVRLAATTERRGNTRRIQTTVTAVAQSAGPAFTVQLAMGAKRPKQQFHVIALGDAHFDRKVVLSGEEPDAVRARIDRPVREALLALPYTIDQLGLTVTAQEVTLAWPGTPSQQPEIETLIRAAVAIAGAKPQGGPARAAPPPTRSSPPAPKGDYLRQLADGFGFTLEQLEANRRGTIHEGQRKKVGVGCGVFFAIFFMLASLGGGVGGAIALYADFQKPISSTDMNGIYALGGAGVVVGFLFLLATIASFRTIARRKAAYLGAPVVFEGPVQKIQITGQHTDHRLNVGGLHVSVPKPGWDLVTQSAGYRLYTANDELLSIEPTGTTSSG